MNVDRPLWQVAAGDRNRDYVALCLRWDVVVLGPGGYGPWPQCEPHYIADDRPRQVPITRRFADEVAAGDVVALRLGRDEVHGVGVVVGDYAWNDHFGDVDGWDLQHVRRVRWVWRASSQPKRFPARTLKFGDSVQPLTSTEVIEWIKSLPDSEAQRPLVDLPAGGEQRLPEADFDGVSEFLFDRGVSNSAVEDLRSDIDEFVRIAGWYSRAELAPSEHETVAYLVVPLLRALGWSPQRMGIEWNNLDAALFAQLPREPANLVAVVEAKRRGFSCFQALSQAEGYVEKTSASRCGLLILTDGIRYCVYTRGEDGGFGQRPRAYLNLSRMMDSYPIYECSGAGEALLLMSADGVHQHFAGPGN